MITQIIIGGILLLLAIISPLIYKMLYTSKAKETDNDSEARPPLSIVITVRNEAEELEHALPLWLNQDYDDYEVIVVIEKGLSETEDAIKRIGHHDRLYTTYIPQSSRYMSRKKLSITLGVKAAHYDWIVLTEPTVSPSGTDWLSKIAKYTGNDYDVVLGHTKFDDSATDFKQLEHLQTAIMATNHALNHRAVRTNMPLIAFQKQEFLANHGFRGNQKYLRGEYDFIVNKYGKRNAVVCNQDMICTESAPTRKQWRNSHLFYQETKQHLADNRLYNFKYNIDQLLLHTVFISSIACIVIGSIKQWYILLGLSSVALLVPIITRTLIARKSLKQYGLQVALWKIPVFDITQIWRNLIWKIRYLRADGYDFISHKI